MRHGCGAVRSVSIAAMFGFAAALAVSTGPAGAKEVYTSASAYAPGQVHRTPVDLDPDHAESSARVANQSPGNVAPDNYGEARAAANFDGPMKVFASVGGLVTDPGPRYPSLEAEAGASQFVEYRVDSATLPAGTPVQGTLTLRFGGTLSITHAPGATFGVNELFADIFAFVQVIGPDDYYSYEGDASLHPEGAFYSGEWDGALDVTDDGNGRLTGTMDLTDTFTFQTKVGEQFAFVYDLTALAWAEARTPVSASVDFFDTATFSLAASPGAQFTTVPEPATPAMILVAGLVALSRRRR